MSSYLTDRKQRVCFKGFSSTPLPVTSGVPQGSCLGPILFNLFINDVSCNILSDHALFADDIVIYRHRQSENDISILQNDIDILALWARNNKMNFNIKKTKLMHITRKRNFVKPLFLLNGEKISAVDTHKHLGVYIDSNLN